MKKSLLTLARVFISILFTFLLFCCFGFIVLLGEFIKKLPNQLLVEIGLLSLFFIFFTAIAYFNIKDKLF